MAKTTTAEQHRLLHSTWPGDCCLCSHRREIMALQDEVKRLREELALHGRRACCMGIRIGGDPRDSCCLGKP